MNESSTTEEIQPLWDLEDDNPLKMEWELFRRERPRLLAEGHEGRWVLIKGEELIGVFDNRDDARNVGLNRFGVVCMLIQQILRQYKVLRQGYSKVVQLFPIQEGRAASETRATLVTPPFSAPPRSIAPDAGCPAD